MHGTPSRGNQTRIRARKICGATLCDPSLAPRTAPLRLSPRRVLAPYYAHGCSPAPLPESSTCDQTTRAALGSTSAPPRRVAPPLNVARQVGCRGHVPVIRTRSTRARLFRRRDLSGSPKPGLSRDARGRGGRGACGSSCSSSRYTLAHHLVLTSSQQYLTPASGPTYKVAPTHRALNTHRTHP
jgi:hypothetical protein